MANEATIRVSLTIQGLQRIWPSSNPAYLEDVSLPDKGPKPGGMTVTPFGTDADLSGLVTPGLCLLTNLDPVNYVEYGIYYVAGNVFLPLGELHPGKPQLIYLSRNLLEGYTNSGTGTTGDVNKLRFKANTANCEITVEAFER